MDERTDDVTFMTRKVVTDAKGTNLKPAIEIMGEGDKRAIRYGLPVGAILSMEDNAVVAPGDIIAKIPRETTKTKDITGGLPRVAELFEARKPKDMAIMADRDGTIEFGADTKGKRKLIIKGLDGTDKDYAIQKGRHVIVTEGDYVRKGEFLVDGSANPHEILEVLGRVALARYLVDEIQEVYRLQGVKINDKHIEVIVRQMLRRVRIVEPGDSRFLPNEQVERTEVEEANRKLMLGNLRPSTWEPVLLGITKASLSTESFISAASFQETTKVLTEASINSKVDHLRGLKENVIMGRLIPAGTGASYYRNLRAVVQGQENARAGHAADETLEVAHQ